MIRRKFLHALGGVAATSPFWSLAGAAMPGHPFPGQSPAPSFGRYTQDYAQFCAAPAAERVFYTVRDGKIVSERLDNNSWRPSPEYSPEVLTSGPYASDNPALKLPVPGGSWDGVPMVSPVPNLAGDGPYKPTWESLLQYECPEWYADAKFGIWNHWSPQCVPEDGDWYARNMYLQELEFRNHRFPNPQYQFQLAHYGPPSRFGYKDLCAQWTLLNWEPSELMDLYANAGARLFIALANHHDGFDTWNSKHHSWNAVNLGPRRDVIGTWAAEARKRNLRFGVTVHQARNWWWFQTSHGADATGPLAGVPYDGRLTLAEGRDQWWQGYDPQQLYAPKHPPDALPDISYVKNFYDRTRDLVDQHNPDLLYFDDALLPLGWGGMNIGAYYYNHSLAMNDGRMEGVLNVKNVPPNLFKAVVADIERGLTNSIQTYPWQSETCIGQWHYLRSLYEWPGEYGHYLPPRDVIHWLVDAVSKNGTFILNIPGKPDGTIDSKERLILERLGEWFKINGEAIYATRAWTVFGEGPNMIKAGSFQGQTISELGASDVRYTRNKAGTVVYGIVLGWPESHWPERETRLLLKSFGASAAKPVKVANVELLGGPKRMRFAQTAEGLHIEWPTFEVMPPSNYAVVFKLSLT
jgi:alpha-L-fucosidase